MYSNPIARPESLANYLMILSKYVVFLICYELQRNFAHIAMNVSLGKQEVH